MFAKLLVVFLAEEGWFGGFVITLDIVLALHQGTTFLLKPSKYYKNPRNYLCTPNVVHTFTIPQNQKYFLYCENCVDLTNHIS